ncbi:uncharacterized protein LOC141814883 isoform X2 [Curcuma longa]|uniref:uncharacterized protein LOC141814883 isoform X2 n=1 Tax=Curcuma longa TaxID=136217 RepID=UPI003D9F78B0
MANRAEKRPLPLDEIDPPKAQAERQVRFPKGKKAKRVDGDGIQDGNGQNKIWIDPGLAAKERSKRRNKMRESEVLGDQVDSRSGEVQYEDNTNFEDDGIQIEPFNLKQEREEGYFDENGNFVEYAKQNEVKDAWLDSVVVDTKLAGKFKPKASAEEEAYDDLSSDDVGKIKRRIANALQPGETIIQALKRLKGSSTDKKAKMLETSKWIFDQLTEDAMKLMENGEYNVYYEDQETFVREAGYERLARAKSYKSNSTTHAEPTDGEDIFSDDVQHREQVSSIWDIRPGTSAVTDSAQQASPSDGGDQFDMFGDDDDTINANPPIPSAASSASDFQQDDQPTSKTLDVSHGGAENDYLYDESSGYYYSNSFGYYYDPTSGMYCSAATGTWYTYDEQNGTYTEIQSSTTGS